MVTSPGEWTALHVAGGVGGEGGVMSFVRAVARRPIEGFGQTVWKHRAFSPGASDAGISWASAGSARETDCGMLHDLRAAAGEMIALRRWLRGRGGVILHGHSRVGLLAAAVVARIERRPMVLHLHKLSGQPRVYRVLAALGRAEWAFNSRRTAAHHGFAGEGTVVVHPPVRWPEAPAPAGTDGPRYIAAGAYARVKQFDRLIAAVRILRERGITAPLEIFGRCDPPFDAAHDAELAALAAATAGVHLRPYDPCWAERLRAEDVFIHPTAREGFGIVIVEAFARGCRIVVPEGTVLADLPAGTGAAGVVTTDREVTPEALAGAMDAASREGADAAAHWGLRRSAAGLFSVERAVCQLRALYRSVSSRA